MASTVRASRTVSVAGASSPAVRASSSSFRISSRVARVTLHVLMEVGIGQVDLQIRQVMGQAPGGFAHLSQAVSVAAERAKGRRARGAQPREHLAGPIRHSLGEGQEQGALRAEALDQRPRRNPRLVRAFSNLDKEASCHDVRSGRSHGAPAQSPWPGKSL